MIVEPGSNMFILRTVLALSMLGMGCYWDLKNREITDYLWVVFGLAALILVFVSSDMTGTLLTMGVALIVAPVSMLIWRLGYFGGADAFSLIVLAALAPGLSFSAGFVSPFTTLVNSVLLSAIPLSVNILRNLASLARHENIFKGFENETRKSKALAMLVGYKAKNPRFSFPIESKANKKKIFDFSLKHADTAEFCSSPDTWVTPAIPYMFFIMSGFVVQLCYGDLLFSFLGIHH